MSSTSAKAEQNALHSGDTFRSDEPLLHTLLDQCGRGLIQVPDFQRGWVWDDDHIRSLIASVTLSYPIGAIMLLESGGDGARFKPSRLQGVDLPTPPNPDQLILDGQQRLTSLFLSIKSGKPVPTCTDKGQEIERVYYLDMQACLDPDADRLDAVLSLPPDRVLRRDFGRQIELDVSSPEREFEKGLFPLSLVFDPARYTEWRLGFQEYFGYNPDKSRFLMRFEQKVWLPLQQYKVPVIVLLRGTPKEAVCQVFEKVNTGGVTLTVFELVTATFAADDYPLRQKWCEMEERLHKHDVLSDVEATSVLTAITLLASYRRHLASGSAVSCKRKDVLKLTLDDYKQYAPEIEQGLVDAARLLAREKVFDSRILPYTTQLIPLAAMCAVLGPNFEREPVKRKLARWFWCGVFGEMYGGANESRFAFDLPEVIRWTDGGEEPRTLRDASFSPVRLLSLQSRLSAAYKGIMAQLMQVGSRDFLSGDPIELTTYFDRAVDVHHIFPKAYCEEKRFLKQQWNSAINKAPISAATNRIIGGRAPSTYLSSLERNHGIAPDRLDEILQSHVIDPRLLRRDDFSGFVRDRASRLLDLIEKAMGKAVPGRDSDEVVAAFGAPIISQTASGTV